MKDVMISKQYRKPKNKDLGLAAIDSHVIFAQMARQESKDHSLKKTTDQRASMRDFNATRPGNFVNDFLGRVTDDVKVPKHKVKDLKEEMELQKS